MLQILSRIPFQDTLQATQQKLWTIVISFLLIIFPFPFPADTCIKAPLVESFVGIDCAGSYNRGSEDRSEYLSNWSRPIQYYSNIDTQSMPWRWQPSDQLNSYPIIGRMDTYFGNGFTVELFPKWKNQITLDQLKEHLWLDRHTRAMIVETVTFNPATNYFQNVAVVFEYSPTGGVVHYNSVITFKLYRCVYKK